MEYNVRTFQGLDRYATSTQDEIVQIIKEKQPDIIALEEYVVRKSDKENITASINRVLNSKSHYFKTYRIASGDSSGIAIFSKLPVIDSGSVPAPEALQIHAAFIDVKYKDRMFRVYSIHLAAVEINANDKAQMLNGNLRLNETSFIQGKLISAFLMRSYQVRYIKNSLDSCPYPYIVMGDFNDTPNSYAVNTLGEGLKSAFAEKGSGWGVTYYSKFPKLQIDHILVNPQFEVLNYEAIDKRVSDHRPVVSDVLFH